MNQSKQKSIIIVDDEDAIRELLSDTFESLGYNVTSVENGLQLIGLLRLEPVDAILLDINMPWVSGFEICRSIKQDPVLKKIKVIYLSGIIKDEKECFATGCDGLIKKPFEINNLLKKVQDLVGEAN